MAAYYKLARGFGVKVTLVYAIIEKKQISIFTDTMTTDPLKPHADNFSNFVVKVRPVSTNLTLSFAGDVCFGEEAFVLIANEDDVTVAAEKLLSHHKKKGKSVDFVLASQQPLKLFRISEGKSSRVNHNCWIGSHNAFERFQAFNISGIRHTPSAHMGIIWLGEKDRPVSSEKYAAVFDAFFELVLENKNGVGGFVVPYIVTKRLRTYGTYVRSFRRPLTLREVGIINWQFYNSSEGAFTVNFGGDQANFTLQVPQIYKTIKWESSVDPGQYAKPFGLS